MTGVWPVNRVASRMLLGFYAALHGLAWYCALSERSTIHWSFGKTMLVLVASWFEVLLCAVVVRLLDSAHRISKEP